MGTHHAKFTNYSFDVGEFMRLVTKLGQDVRERKLATLSVSLDIDKNGKDHLHIHDDL